MDGGPLGGFADEGKVPKAYRYQIHRLKISYRQSFHKEPPIERPTTEKAAKEVIEFLEREIRRGTAAGTHPDEE